MPTDRLRKRNAVINPQEVGKEKVSALLALIRRRGRKDAADAIETLVAIMSPEADLALLQLLDHPVSQVRETVLERLGERAPWLARLAGRAMLSDNDSAVRSSAARGLYETATNRDRRRLIAALADMNEEWLLRAFAADALTSVRGKTVRDALLYALKTDPEPIVRRDAAFALACGVFPGIISELEEALSRERDEQPLVGLLSSLYLLGQPERLTPLLAFLHSDDSTVRYTVLNTVVGQINAGAGIVSPDDRAAIIAALEALVETEETRGLKADATAALASLR